MDKTLAPVKSETVTYYDDLFLAERYIKETGRPNRERVGKLRKTALGPYFCRPQSNLADFELRSLNLRPPKLII